MDDSEAVREMLARKESFSYVLSGVGRRRLQAFLS